MKSLQGRLKNFVLQALVPALTAAALAPSRSFAQLLAPSPASKNTSSVKPSVSPVNKKDPPTKNKKANSKDELRIPLDVIGAARKLMIALEMKEPRYASTFTHFPLENKVAGEKKEIAQDEFEKRYFDRYQPLYNCFQTKMLQPDGKNQRRWFLNCDGARLSFAKFGDIWLHTGFEKISPKK